ncbi:MAG: hypothetical protein AAGD96_16845 [Chloroflexota bacterium]
MTSFRDTYIQKQVDALRDRPEIIALWEAGSAATRTTDQYSDLDLTVLCSCEVHQAFELIEAAMPPISHRYIEPEGIGLSHRIYFHDGAPKHFYADIGVLHEEAQDALSELMVIERHGKPVVFFDKKGLIKPRPMNKIEWQAKLETRVKELEEAFPIYIVQVLKALDRNRNAEAFAFFYHGLLRKLVELMGIRFRPYRYDFELRYLERDFPKKEQESIYKYMTYVDPVDLREKVGLVAQDIKENLEAIKRDGIFST